MRKVCKKLFISAGINESSSIFPVIIVALLLFMHFVCCSTNREETQDAGIDADVDNESDASASDDAGGDSDSGSDTDTDADTDADADADASSDSGNAGFCGNAVIEGSEECDDANDVDMDGCHECSITAILVDEGDSTRTVYGPDVAFMKNGAFAVAWLSNNDDENPLDTDLFLKIFDKDGVVAVDDVPVTDSGWDISIASGTSGNLVIIWSELGTKTFAARLYDSSGTPLTDAFDVNTFSDADSADVAMAADGSFVAVWTSFDSNEQDLAVFARRFDSAGAALGGEWRINGTAPSQGATAPLIEMDDNGNFIVAGSLAMNLSSTNFGMRFEADGTEIQDTTGIGWGSSYPALAVAPDGRFAVAYCDVYCDVTSARIYDEDAEGMGETFDVGEGNPEFIGINDDDEVYVFCQSWDVSSKKPVFTAGRYESDGTLIGSSFDYIDPPPEQGFQSAGMDMMPRGHFVTAWDIGTRDADNNPIRGAVYVQRFSDSGRKLGTNPWP